jgi:DeoR/GlpR family transcriptional regulator of sugar metabolism
MVRNSAIRRESAVLKKERQREILRLIRDRGKAEVEELSERLRVSYMTIRRDLGELNDRGLLERVHGGALLQATGGADQEPPVVERTKASTEGKRRIGLRVASLVQDGEKIFLGSGSTTAFVAEALLQRRRLTVVTNALNIALSLMAAPEIEVTVTGGFLRRSEMSLIGHFAEHTLKNLQVDKVIIGMRGIDPVKGLTSDNMEELITDQAILNISKNIIVAADHRKFGHVAAIRTAPVTAATSIVTDEGGPRDILEALRKMGVRIVEVGREPQAGTVRGGS